MKQEEEIEQQAVEIINKNLQQGFSGTFGVLFLILFFKAGFSMSFLREQLVKIQTVVFQISTLVRQENTKNLIWPNNREMLSKHSQHQNQSELRTLLNHAKQIIRRKYCFQHIPIMNNRA